MNTPARKVRDRAPPALRDGVEWPRLPSAKPSISKSCELEPEPEPESKALTEFDRHQLAQKPESGPTPKTVKANWDDDSPTPSVEEGVPPVVGAEPEPEPEPKKLHPNKAKKSSEEIVAAATHQHWKGSLHFRSEGTFFVVKNEKGRKNAAAKQATVNSGTWKCSGGKLSLCWYKWPDEHLNQSANPSRFIRQKPRFDVDFEDSWGEFSSWIV
jgi:hypothetical protein